MGSRYPRNCRKTDIVHDLAIMQTVIRYRGYQLNVKNFPGVIDGATQVLASVNSLPGERNPFHPFLAHMIRTISEKPPAKVHADCIEQCKTYVDREMARVDTARLLAELG